MKTYWYGPAGKATAERLAAAIRKDAVNPAHEALAKRADTGEFGDYASTHICPITELYRLLVGLDLSVLAARVKDGEFDASMEESDEWAASAEGRAALSQLSASVRRSLK